MLENLDNEGKHSCFTALCRRPPRRKKMEWLRAKLQESEQARGSGGARLGAPAGSVWGPSDADWLSAAKIGRRRRNAAGDALAQTTVRL